MEITGDCSTIYNNTLYVYSPEGFASIPLKENGKWIPLPEPKYTVTSPACVKGEIYGSKDEAFYLVGGTGPSDNSGLQRFSFSSNKWETLPMTASDMKNRTGHGVGYLSSTSEILVYAGNTDGSKSASQSTLLISTETYGVNSGLAQGAPAAYQPIILPWGNSQLAFIGGSTTNTAIFVYDPSNGTGFTVSEATLPSPIESTSLCALVSEGDDMVLQEFKMDSSPNTVTSFLLKSKGKLQSPAPVVSSSEKRSITDSSNSTFAPKESWSEYALAQGNGIVVLSNGQNSDSLAVFNQTSNGWVNSTALFFGSGDQTSLRPSTTSLTTSSTPTSTSSDSTSATTTPTSSSTSAAAAGGGLSDHGKTILGATLGSVLGFGLILLIILLLLRREKEKKKKLAAQSDTRGDSKDRLSFQDQGIEPLTEGAYPMARSPVPLAASASADSLAIMTGNYSGEKSLRPPGATGYGLAAGKSSPLSTIPSSGALGASSVYTDETDRTADSPGRGNQPGDRTTDEGWGKYFEENGGTNLQSDRSTMSSIYTKSDYRGSGWPMANLAPLNFGFLDQPKPLGQVFSGSPTTEVSSSDMGSRSLVIPEGQSARISSVDSISVTSDDDRDDPNWQGAAHSSWLGRPSSSNYSNSFYDSSTRDLAGRSANTGLADKARQSHRRSSIMIPDNIDEDELPIQGQNNNPNSDMSWLNLKVER
jgi:predicted lipid-binding transport protein (Tim44 family)